MWLGFQAACNMFLQHIEVIADDAEAIEGDLVFIKHKELGSPSFYVVERGITENEPMIEMQGLNGGIKVPVRRFNFNGIVGTICKRNGKYAIRESDLIKGGE
jgi:hypothetical protein